MHVQSFCCVLIKTDVFGRSRYRRCKVPNNIVTGIIFSSNITLFWNKSVTEEALLVNNRL